MIAIATHRPKKSRLLALAVFGFQLSVLPGARYAHAAEATCVGDCQGTGQVTVDDILTMVNIALGSVGISACEAGDADGSGAITVDEILTAQSNVLTGCPNSSGTPTPTATPGISPTPPTSIDGLASTITDVVIDSTGQITVTFTLTDGHGVALIPVLSSTQDPAQARVRFTIAHVENYSGGGELGNTFSRYVNDINLTRPGFDSGGTLEAIDATAGVYYYFFKTTLPAGFDSTQTYTVGMQIDRTINGQRIGVDPIFDLVPAGGMPQIRQDVVTEQCNHCHNPLVQHGNRREVRLCTLCHTEAATDPDSGITIQFRNMIHKIHAGKDLPSVADGPPGAQYKIGNTVFAEKDADGNVTGVGFPRSLESCTICHAQGVTTHYYTDRPAAAACATCHDDVNPSLETTAAGPPGTNHFQNKGFADGDCAFCHVADSGDEFDISVKGAHTIPARSTQLKGLNASITGVANTAAGQAPTISFRITENSGTALTSLSGLNRVGFTIAGPTTDYRTVLTATAVGNGSSGTLTGPDGDGVFEYTPASPLPATASGTWSVGVEARRSVTLTTVDPIAPKTVNEATPNEVVTFSIGSAAPLARRTVVDVMNCGSCHGEFSKDFSIHGGLRNQTEYCVLCHNPNNSDVSQRATDPEQVAAGAMVTPIDFKVMIHKIHRGEDLEQQPYVIYGFGGNPNIFSDLRFPGDLRDCQTCHVDTTYLLPPYPGTALGTQVAHLNPDDGTLVVDGRLGPIRSVCTACHDGEDAVAHAETMTAASDGAEACPVCHEEGAAFAVSEMHAGRN